MTMGLASCFEGYKLKTGGNSGVLTYASAKALLECSLWPTLNNCQATADTISGQVFKTKSLFLLLGPLLYSSCQVTLFLAPRATIRIRP